MRLLDILHDIKYEILLGKDCEIKNLTIDSRQTNNGSMFFCIRGLHVDGHDFIKDAIINGASCIVIDKDKPEYLNENIKKLDKYTKSLTIIKVPNVRKALAFCSANFFKNPSSKIILTGITGTNGKTSTTYFLESILREKNKNVGVIGTIDSRINGEHINIFCPTPTTPDAIELQNILSKMQDKNVEHAIIEVSSHALALNKVDSLKFKIGAFTNLSQDHLDFHKNMQDYLAAKTRLFNMCELGIINIDDCASKYISKNSSCKFISYGIKSECNFRAVNINYNESSVSFDLEINMDKINKKIKDFFVPIPGIFTVYNALCAIACAFSLDVDFSVIKSALSKIKSVPGRMQRINSDDFNIIVDYAHSPDSLENVLRTVREFAKGQIITVFGCGGDRDKLKRPIMGEIASKFSDYCIITSDNPRTEPPMQIIDEIARGVINNKKYEKIEDRYKAIEKAINIAKKNDVIIIAGKGHENYQIFFDRTIHFDDVEVATKILSEKNKKIPRNN